MKPKNRYLVFIPALIAWAFFVGWGWAKLSEYQSTPGKETHAVLQQWPAISKIPRDSGLPTMVMFVHPRCPCSRASMAQLAFIMTHTQNKVRAQVVFVKPESFDEDWVHSDLYNHALRIPGVNVMVDEGGKEARMFHAGTSGHVLVYDTAGQLVFNGGITSARGHQGDNAGQESIISFLTKGEITTEKTPFFGCLLSSQSES